VALSSPRIALAAILAVVLAPPVARAQNPQVTVPTGRTAAQDAAAQRYGRNVTNEEIANAIRSSGMSQADIRARLQQAGIAPSIADAFFAQGGISPSDGTADADTNFVAALSAMGILGGGGAAASGLPVGAVPGMTEGEISVVPELVFGRGIFARRTSLFDPIVSGPVDPSYRVGIGDQLQVVFTGDVEAAYQVEVRRDGAVILPQVGRVPLAGLTVDGARGLLRQRAARAYSGIASGKTSLDMTIAQVRTSQVYVLGEVESPGAYQVSALATVFHAIARAGGPTTRGSFRQIEVRRGGKLFQTIDIYPYLLTGDGALDIRLEQGDVVFVPLAQRNIEVKGAVRRPALFELTPTEGFDDLLRYAGGLLATASTDRLMIDRVLPPEQRTPGHDRAIVDVKFSGRVATLDTVSLVDGDIVTAFGVTPLRRNAIEVTGEVFQPGTFEWRPGMTVGDAMTLAQGAKPWGLTDRVKVRRAILASGRSESYSINLDSAGARTFALAEFDTLSVLDGRLLYPEGPVRIFGAVVKQGIHPYTERQTLRDLLDQADGFREGASVVEVARRRVGQTYADTSAVIYEYPIDPVSGAIPGADTLLVERYDIITVRFSPGYRRPETVTLNGSFTYPGTFTLLADGERLSSVVRRAGGLLPTGYPESFRLLRDGRPVAIDLEKAMDGDRLNDIVLEAGDYMSVGPNPSVVQVSGAVQRQVSIPFTPGWDMGDYIDAAGGATKTADKGKRYIEYASGAIRRPGHFLFFSNDPNVRPGATIHIPEKPQTQSDGNVGEIFATTFQIVATLASLAIAYLAATQ
jgi:polysaccharide export outer membrane protein